MRLRPLIPLLVVAFAAAQVVNAQATRVSVFVGQTGDDAVGQSLAYSVREELRRSAGFTVAVQKDAALTVGIVSLDAGGPSEPKGVWSAVAVSFTMANYLPYDKSNPQTWYAIYLTTTVHTVGRSRVEAVAKSIVANLDSELEAYRAAANRN